MNERVQQALRTFDQRVKPAEFVQEIKLMKLIPGEYNRGFQMDVPAYGHLVPGSDAMNVALSLSQRGAIPYIAIDEKNEISLFARLVRGR